MVVGFLVCVLDFATIVISDGICILQKTIMKIGKMWVATIRFMTKKACNSKTFVIIPDDHIIGQDSTISMG
jgi:hypothetical protein